MENIDVIIQILEKETKSYIVPIVTKISKARNPFKVLISCLLSLRTKDQVTAEASVKLFLLADTPEKMQKLSAAHIEKAIYPVGFYKTKAKRIKEICRTLTEIYGGNTPDEIDELLKLKGVGRKTANLVVTLGYGKLGICVDTHVHRISNRLGFIKTKTPEQTEFALRKILPEKYWIIYNDLLVSYGQNVCRPISPKCSNCKLFKYCRRVGVEKFR
ncbi:MAG: endonuclease III [Candidatus Scalindua sp.]|nr:endonuclease III [Candidatus Scalindua sp.]